MVFSNILCHLKLNKSGSEILSSLSAKKIDGWCALQTGGFSFQSHREQVEYVKNYWDWYRNTHTII